MTKTDALNIARQINQSSSRNHAGKGNVVASVNIIAGTSKVPSHAMVEAYNYTTGRGYRFSTVEAYNAIGAALEG